MPATIPYHQCMVAAAAAYKLPVRALPAIQRVEGGRVGTVSANKDGSHDLGLMQVNTRWVTPLARATGLAPQTVVTRLILSPCFNIVAAASILRQYIDEEHGDVWRAIGDYHSHTRWLSTTYKLKVLEQAMQLPQAPAVRKPAHKARKKDEALAAE
ncbi:lytic transglycosylase domain-containing protein [Acidisoma sp. 7E03]